MRAVIQKVKSSNVKVEGKIVGEIKKGYMVLLGITHTDGEKEIDWLVKKIKDLRIFEDENEKLNLSIEDVKGELLVISQFTLYGDCIKGRRPSFTQAAKSDIAISLYEKFVEKCRSFGLKTETGIFGAHMDVELINDGPVTIIIDTCEVASLNS